MRAVRGKLSRHADVTEAMDYMLKRSRRIDDRFLAMAIMAVAGGEPMRRIECGTCPEK
jgi:hypothetical protein